MRLCNNTALLQLRIDSPLHMRSSPELGLRYFQQQLPGSHQLHFPPAYSQFLSSHLQRATNLTLSYSPKTKRTTSHAKFKPLHSYLLAQARVSRLASHKTGARMLCETARRSTSGEGAHSPYMTAACTRSMRVIEAEEGAALYGLGGYVDLWSEMESLGAIGHGTKDAGEIGKFLMRKGLASLTTHSSMYKRRCTRYNS